MSQHPWRALHWFDLQPRQVNTAGQPHPVSIGAVPGNGIVPAKQVPFVQLPQMLPPQVEDRQRNPGVGCQLKGDTGFGIERVGKIAERVRTRRPRLVRSDFPGPLLPVNRNPVRVRVAAFDAVVGTDVVHQQVIRVTARVGEIVIGIRGGTAVESGKQGGSIPLPGRPVFVFAPDLVLADISIAMLLPLDVDIAAHRTGIGRNGHGHRLAGMIRRVSRMVVGRKGLLAGRAACAPVRKGVGDAVIDLRYTLPGDIIPFRHREGIFWEGVGCTIYFNIAGIADPDKIVLEGDVKFSFEGCGDGFCATDSFVGSLDLGSFGIGILNVCPGAACPVLKKAHIALKRLLVHVGIYIVVIVPTGIESVRGSVAGRPPHDCAAAEFVLQLDRPATALPAPV